MDNKRIVILGGCGLAFGAAFANTGLVIYTGTSVSHLTGDMARLSLELSMLGSTHGGEVVRVASAAGFFFIGAILAGIFVHHLTLDLSRPYGRSVTFIGALFILASLLLSRFPVGGIALAALGCGLQNALAAHYRGIVLRTTHLTGLVTDMGVTLGMKLRGHDIPVWKIAVPFCLILSFFAGGICAGTIYFLVQYDTVLIAGIAYCAAGIGWSLWKARHLQAS